jgi:hypothetical protein
MGIYHEYPSKAHYLAEKNVNLTQMNGDFLQLLHFHCNTSPVENYGRT